MGRWITRRKKHHRPDRHIDILSIWVLIAFLFILGDAMVRVVGPFVIIEVVLAPTGMFETLEGQDYSRQINMLKMIDPDKEAARSASQGHWHFIPFVSYPPPGPVPHEKLEHPLLSLLGLNLKVGELYRHRFSIVRLGGPGAPCGNPRALLSEQEAANKYYAAEVNWPATVDWLRESVESAACEFSRCKNGDGGLPISISAVEFLARYEDFAARYNRALYRQPDFPFPTYCKAIPAIYADNYPSWRNPVGISLWFNLIKPEDFWWYEPMVKEYGPDFY